MAARWSWGRTYRAVQWVFEASHQRLVSLLNSPKAKTVSRRPENVVTMRTAPSQPVDDSPRPKLTGTGRIVNAARCSVAGLHTAFRDEAAFRQEIVLGCLTLPFLVVLPTPAFYKLAVLCTYCGVLIAELLNTAVEKVSDRISMELHPLAKQAKDTSSAAVFISIVALAIAWSFALAART